MGDPKKNFDQGITPSIPQGRLRADLGKRVEEFDKVVKQLGADANIWIGQACPCIGTSISSGTGLPIPNCNLCNGTGRYYPDAANTIRVLPQRADSRQQRNAGNGWVEQGSMEVTVPSTVSLDYYDRIQFTKFNSRISQNLNRNGTDPYTFLLHPVLLVESMYLFVSIDEATQLLQGIDFELEHDTLSSKIVWLKGTELADAQVSIRYQANPVWWVWRLPHAYRGQQAKQGFDNEMWSKLPQQVTLMRADMALLRGTE